MFVGSTLTPLTPIPVSEIHKSTGSMLSASSLSVLGEQQFQTGRRHAWLQLLIRLTQINFRSINDRSSSSISSERRRSDFSASPRGLLQRIFLLLTISWDDVRRVRIRIRFGEPSQQIGELLRNHTLVYYAKLVLESVLDRLVFSLFQEKTPMHRDGKKEKTKTLAENCTFRSGDADKEWLNPNQRVESKTQGIMLLISHKMQKNKLLYSLWINTTMQTYVAFEVLCKRSCRERAFQFLSLANVKSRENVVFPSQIRHKCFPMKNRSKFQFRRVVINVLHSSKKANGK